MIFSMSDVSWSLFVLWSKFLDVTVCKFYQPLILYCWSMYVLLLWFFFFKLKLTIFLCRIVDAKLGRLLCLLMGLGFYTAGFIKVIKWSFHFRVNNLWSAIEIYCYIRTVAEISRVFSSTSKQRKWRLFWN